ncbi:phage head closure protein [Ihubacter massiliensis]|uniref:phage head closure protein n=1 Tax=Ihubacter massiliensis TaxID=1852367 RepID=UPI0020976A36|nr:phage head closure protein [Ihubacter massiliensis]MCI7301318.1 phage head closure protein [Clostridia bacterium]MCO7120590.1 phage head closure protein [Ihubacter massiliensis]MDY3010602.1 phage head closure protein [Clostridiales Family XIII bacterium]
MKPLNVGKLNKRITFVLLEDGIDEFGQNCQAWKEYKTVWATVKALRGGEYYEAQKIRPEQTYKITTRYHPGITPDMKIQYCEKLLEIISCNNVEEADYMLEIQAVEYVEREE